MSELYGRLLKGTQKKKARASKSQPNARKGKVSTSTPSSGKEKHKTSKTASNRDVTISAGMLEKIRSRTKKVGKEQTTHRLLKEEKRELEKIVYLYSREGLKTSENEVARIAINFLIENHKKRNKNSILYQLLALLHK